MGSRPGEPSPGSGEAPRRPDQRHDDALRVLIVDDHPIFRAGLRRMLADQGLDVMEARSGASAVELVGRVAPDVVLMDLHMPDMSGVEATRLLSKMAADVPVVMLTASTEDRDVVEAVRAGARGYLVKDSGLDEIVAAVRAAAAGDSWVSPRVTTVLLDHVRETGGGSAEDPLPVQLSDRERDVLVLIAEGKDNVAIARELYISPGTVRKHVSSLLSKLEVGNRVEAAVYAVRRGLA